MIPAKLKQGDEIRVVAPSRSLSIISKENQKIATKKLESLGYKLTFGKNASEIDEFGSSSIQARVEDLHEAFSDKNVKAVFSVIGGYNCNQILKYLDYNLIKQNPKILIGYSDTTALENAIYAKTGLVTYSGPAYSTFGMKKGFEYIEDSFKKCLTTNQSYIIETSKETSDDVWYLDQEKRTFKKNPGTYVINNGEAEGTLIGGNLCTLNLLQGTEYMPSLKDSVLFLEDDYESKIENFDRDLQSLIHLPNFKYVKGIVIGRFESKSKVTRALLTKAIKSKQELDNIPVIADADFGHNNPIATFPIGGKVKISAYNKTKIEILWH